jgi:cation transport ATPase
VASPPLNGVVVKGIANFDEPSLVGEARLVSKDTEDAISAGAVNRD